VTTALERVVSRAADRRRGAIERCGVCAVEVPPRHRHLVEPGGGIACACPACFLLIDRQPEGSGPYRAIPDRRVRLRPVPVEELNVPVGLAYFVPDRGRVVAHYPSPLGHTESEVDDAAWRAVLARTPALASLQPGLEAFLVRGVVRDGPGEQWLVPIDDCYRLVATVRQHWTGLSGGSAIWTAIARFFDELAHTRHEEEH
jgi:Family of unknown function (DUF5947)